MQQSPAYPVNFLGAIHQLGSVAQEQRQWAEARNHFLKDLTITAESNDEHGLGITLRSLARLWKASGDERIPGAVAQALNAEGAEVEALLKGLLDETGEGEGGAE